MSCRFLYASVRFALSESAVYFHVTAHTQRFELSPRGISQISRVHHTVHATMCNFFIEVTHRNNLTHTHSITRPRVRIYFLSRGSHTINFFHLSWLAAFVQQRDFDFSLAHSQATHTMIHAVTHCENRSRDRFIHGL